MLLLAAIILMSACQTKNSDNQINNQDKAKMETIEIQKIEELLFTYRDALNASDVSKVLPLYTEDGIFMPSGGAGRHWLHQKHCHPVHQQQSHL